MKIKTSMHIDAFGIDDGELRGEPSDNRVLTTPCKLDPDLYMQLDAWGVKTSISALLNDEHSVLHHTRYDQ